VMYFKAVKLAEHLFRLLAESKMLEVKVWHPRFLINSNCWSKQLTVVKSWSTWAITSKTWLALNLEHLWQVNLSYIVQNPS
jgi:hypothetical protein